MRAKRWLAILILFLIAGSLSLARQAPVALAANLASLDLWRRVAGAGHLLAASRLARLPGALQAGSASRLRLLARLQAADGDLAESEATYRATLARHPGDTLALFELANLLVDQGREAEALPLWTQARAGPYWRARGAERGGCDEGPTGGLRYLWRAVQIDPTDGMSQYQLGNALAQCEQWEGAIAALSAAIASGNLETSALASAFTIRGLASYSAGLGLEAARADIERATQLQPRDPWPWLRLSALYRQEKRYDEALAACDRAIELAPKHAYAYHYRGQAWRAAGEPEKAIADFEQALSLDPKMQAAQNALNKIRKK